MTQPNSDRASTETTAAPSTARPFYAALGDRLHNSAPRMFSLLQLCRRAIAGLWRRKVWTLPVLLGAIALFIAGFRADSLETRILFLGAGVFAVLGFGLFYLAHRVFQYASALSRETAHLRQSLATVKQAQAGEQEELHSLAETVDASAKKFDLQIATVSRDLIRRANAVASELVDRRATAQNNDIEALRRQLQSTEKQQKSEFAKMISANGKIVTQLAALKNDIEKTASDASQHATRQDARFKETENAFAKLVEDTDEALEAFRSAAAAADEHMQKLNASLAMASQRIAAGERQLRALRYPDAPACVVFFGHHKCGSRFFRHEVFSRVAEATGARIRRYKIQSKPFHYSRSEDLDLCNMDFDGLGKDGVDVVLFSNATDRTLEKIATHADDWRGLRILRDPRQVLISNYFHHKGEHPFRAKAGWVWDKLEEDKPVLRALNEEDGILYELDNISKDIIDNQLLAAFDDDRVLTMKLEEFSEDPRGGLQRIADFLQVAEIAGIDLDATYANPESGAWRMHFTDKIRAAFKERYGQALIDLGYADDLDW